MLLLSIATNILLVVGLSPTEAPAKAVWNTGRRQGEGSGRGGKGPRRTGSGGADVEEGGSRAAATPTASSLPGLIGNALGLRLGSLGGAAYDSPTPKPGQAFKWVRPASMQS